MDRIAPKTGRVRRMALDGRIGLAVHGYADLRAPVTCNRICINATLTPYFSVAAAIGISVRTIRRAATLRQGSFRSVRSRSSEVKNPTVSNFTSDMMFDCCNIHIHSSAKTGRYVSTGHGKSNPRTTVREK